MSRVVALMDDLFFQMKVAETAKHLGVELRVATTGEALLSLLEPRPGLVIVDLNSRNRPIEAVERLRVREPHLPVVAFLSHVQHDLAAEAQRAGCSEVLPRSAFTLRLAEILGRAKD